MNFQFWQNSVKFGQNKKTVDKKWQKIGGKNQQFLKQKLESRERCKGVHCVDLGESFPTSIDLQILVSIQPRTSPVKFAGNIVELLLPSKYFDMSTSREFEIKV